jgi:protein-S-isoprenylcysteine O-methyltransferase Ste14
VSRNKDAAAVRIFPPAVPALAILIALALEQVWPISAADIIPAPERYWVGGGIILSAILGLGVASVVAIRRTGQTENPWSPTTKIVQSGPFRLSRNPLYLQMVLVSLGAAVLLANVWLILLTPIVGWTLQHFAIRPEEAYLEAKFGEAYLSYKRRVRRWL